MDVSYVVICSAFWLLLLLISYLSKFITKWQFIKDASRYVEENKLKVALISPLHSEEISPIKGDINYELSREKEKIFRRDDISSREPMVRKNSLSPRL